MTQEMLKQLSKWNFKAISFRIAKVYGGNVFKTEMVTPLDLFVKLPCLETAVNLMTVWPVTLPVMTAASDPLDHTLPFEGFEEWFEGFQEWMPAMEANLEAAAAVQRFLLMQQYAGHLKVGFHRPRDQAPLLERLRQVGIRKSIFARRHRFLAGVVTNNPWAYRAVADLICIYAQCKEGLRYWNSVGAECEPQLWLQAEIMYDISQVAEAFVGLFHRPPPRDKELLRHQSERARSILERLKGEVREPNSAPSPPKRTESPEP